MRLAMVGLGRMGANIVRRLLRDGHECVVYDVNPAAVAELVAEGAVGAESIADLATQLDGPRVVWVMIPAGITGQVVDHMADHMLIERPNKAKPFERRQQSGRREVLTVAVRGAEKAFVV